MRRGRHAEIDQVSRQASVPQQRRLLELPGRLLVGLLRESRRQGAGAQRRPQQLRRRVNPRAQKRRLDDFREKIKFVDPAAEALMVVEYYGDSDDEVARRMVEVLAEGHQRLGEPLVVEATDHPSHLGGDRGRRDGRRGPATPRKVPTAGIGHPRALGPRECTALRISRSGYARLR